MSQTLLASGGFGIMIMHITFEVKVAIFAYQKSWQYCKTWVMRNVLKKISRGLYLYEDTEINLL